MVYKMNKNILTKTFLILSFCLSLLMICGMVNVKELNLFQTIAFIIFMETFLFSGHFFLLSGKNSQKIKNNINGV